MRGLQVHAGHVEALEILVWVLGDMPAAEAYCFRSWRDVSGTGLDPCMLLALVRVLLTPPETSQALSSHQQQQQGNTPAAPGDVKSANLQHAMSLLERYLSPPPHHA